MANYRVEIPESLANEASFVDVSLDNFVISAVREKLQNMKDMEYLMKRASRANVDDFRKVMAKVPSREPFYPEDKI